MNDPTRTEATAVVALRAAINDIVRNRAADADTDLLYSAVHAIAAHTIAVATKASGQRAEAVLKHATADVPVYPDSPKGH